MRKSIPGILILLLFLLLLLPFTDFGAELLDVLSEPANREEANILTSPESEPDPPEQFPPIEQDSACQRPESSIVPVPSEQTSVSTPPDFVGEYELLSVEGADDITDELLEEIRTLGIPLSLVIRADGSAETLIFDEITQFHWEGDRLLVEDGEIECPILYEGGRLQLLEYGIIMTFCKTSS